MKEPKMSQSMHTAIKKHGVQQLLVQIIKALAFCIVTIALLCFTEGNHGLLLREAYPNIFWSVTAFLIVVPILYFKFYRFLLRPTFRGTVTKIKNDSRLGGREGDIKGFIGRGHFVEMGRIDICFVTVQTERGRQHTFTYPREKAAFARAYYQIGDSVFCPAFANFPFSENRTPEKPICLCCGELATVDEDMCPKCNVPLVK